MIDSLLDSLSSSRYVTSQSMSDGFQSEVIISVKWFYIKEKCSMRANIWDITTNQYHCDNHYFGIKWAKFHVTRAVGTEITLFGHGIYIASSVNQPEKKSPIQLS